MKDNIEQLKKLKELLDSGNLTKQEYNIRKTELLFPAQVDEPKKIKFHYVYWILLGAAVLLTVVFTVYEKSPKNEMATTQSEIIQEDTLNTNELENNPSYHPYEEDMESDPYQEPNYSDLWTGQVISYNNQTYLIPFDHPVSHKELYDYIDERFDSKKPSFVVPSYEEMAELYEPNSTAGNGYMKNGVLYKAKMNSIFNSIGSGAWFWVSHVSINNLKCINMYNGLEIELGNEIPKFPIHSILILKNPEDLYQP